MISSMALAKTKCHSWRTPTHLGHSRLEPAVRRTDAPQPLKRRAPHKQKHREMLPTGAGRPEHMVTAGLAAGRSRQPRTAKVIKAEGGRGKENRKPAATRLSSFILHPSFVLPFRLPPSAFRQWCPQPGQPPPRGTLGLSMAKPRPIGPSRKSIVVPSRCRAIFFLATTATPCCS